MAKIEHCHRHGTRVTVQTPQEVTQAMSTRESFSIHCWACPRCKLLYFTATGINCRLCDVPTNPVTFLTLWPPHPRPEAAK
jgi:hypothetical protein